MSADPFLKIFIALLLYIAVLVILRSLNVWKKKACENCNNCCPDCESGLNRMIISIDGIIGCGKSTQINKLMNIV